MIDVPQNNSKPTFDVERLDLILNELSKLDPSRMTDDELADYVKNKPYSKYTPYHCKLIRFGKILTLDNPPYKPKKKIEVFYENKRGLKNITDLIYSVNNRKGQNIVSKLIYPWYFVNIFWGGEYWDYINNSNIESLLENKTVLLISSFEGKDKYGKLIKTWQMISLTDDTSKNASIFREYLLKAYRWSIVSLIENNADKFDINLTQECINNKVRPILNKVDAIIDSEKHKFIKKEDNPSYKRKLEEKRLKRLRESESYYDIPSQRSNEDSYLNDELDYIRQNGGDWIDD